MCSLSISSRFVGMHICCSTLPFPGLRNKMFEFGWEVKITNKSTFPPTITVGADEYVCPTSDQTSVCLSLMQKKKVFPRWFYPVPSLQNLNFGRVTTNQPFVTKPSILVNDKNNWFYRLPQLICSQPSGPILVWRQNLFSFRWNQPNNLVSSQ